MLWWLFDGNGPELRGVGGSSFSLIQPHKQAVCVRLHACPTSGVWLGGCFVRLSALKPKCHTDRNHSLRLIWFCLQREQFVFALYQWVHQKVHASLLFVSVCVSVYLFLCLQYKLSVCLWMQLPCACGFAQRCWKAALTSSPTAILQSPGCDLPTWFLHPQWGFSYLPVMSAQIKLLLTG